MPRTAFLFVSYSVHQFDLFTCEENVRGIDRTGKISLLFIKRSMRNKAGIYSRGTLCAAGMHTPIDRKLRM